MTAPTRGRPRDPALDQAILDAALNLFLSHGITGMSIEQVAKRAGVGKPTVYRRWPSKELLVSDAIESFVTTEIRWPSREEVAAVAPQELIRRNIDAATRTAAEPKFRALIAQIYGSTATHPKLMQTYWEHYVLPRRKIAFAMLERAQAEGSVPADAELDVLVDMMAGAVNYRILQPNPPNARQLKRYLESVYRQVGLLPRS
jgi:AcrR family transcriptional regulator